MKTVNYWFAFLAFGVSGIVGAGAAASAAEGIPRLSEILSNTCLATIPTRVYSATVHQTVSHTNLTGSPSKMAPSVSSNDADEVDYLVSCSTSGVLHATKGLSIKRNAQTTSGTSAPVAQTINNMRLLITMNPINTLRHIETLASATTTSEVFQNVPCYRVSATDRAFEFICWVRKGDSCVSRQVILQNSNVVLDTQFEYQKWNGFFVPSQVIMTKPLDGIRVLQTFSGHAY
jgi:hypothetical protein